MIIFCKNRILKAATTFRIILPFGGITLENYEHHITKSIRSLYKKRLPAPLIYLALLGMHDLMVHDYGPGHQFASLHVELPAEQDPLEAHDLIDNIEREFLKNDRLFLTIHSDPLLTSDAAVGGLRARLTEKLRQLDPALSLHDLRIVPGRTHTNVLFDLVLPAGYAGDKVELLTQLEQFIKEQDAAYSCIIKVEQSYTAAHK